MIKNYKTIPTVPLSTELIDNVLSKTMRKTPTVIHNQRNTGKIRAFYTKKIKFAANEFQDRLSRIINSFPILEDIHPFYADLFNVLYDRDHYKMALGHINVVRNTIKNIGDEYIRLLKYGDTLYRCKQLKRAGLGKMATAAKKLTPTLEYLEQVRQHMSRVPSIDPSARTLLICGFPNVGKSSFMNKISRAQVDVQPYAFTTKSLFVGHFDYAYLRFQVIDTPGILDHPIEERNLIEMQSITALAHLRATVLYFFDLSENCGFPVADQIALLVSLEPLLVNQILLVFSKCDLKPLSVYLNEEDDGTLAKFLEGRRYVELSSQEEMNVDLVKNTACDMLVDEKLKKKMESEKITEFMNRIKVVRPLHLREKGENVLVAEDVVTERMKEVEDPEYVFDDRKNNFVAEEERYDEMPEFYDGKNLADFVDEKIMQRLDELEEEENEQLEKYAKEYDILSKEERAMKDEIVIARRARIQEYSMNKRASIPKRWKKQSKETEKNVSEKKDKLKVALPKSEIKLKMQIEKIRKKVNKRYYDKTPKHAFRGAPKKRGKW
ncbi:Nucleolar GTP-binding protein 1 [Astathelohania contejeani]|uniref:Nucleolar GTP-binding protein 1 n=1 Tax=Astathelohania contejeani TaxID=164912 RepID=A0ABQ7HY58_9MICR|nr:Nucleolar GTP-binding protein 1 [Thelohania contejeani]